jgi:hypothetical protein
MQLNIVPLNQLFFLNALIKENKEIISKLKKKQYHWLK